MSDTSTRDRVALIADMPADEARALLAAIGDTLHNGDDPETMADALAIGAALLAGDRDNGRPSVMVRTARAAVRMARADRIRAMAGRPDRGELPAPASLDALAAAVGDALAVMPDGRLTVADPDPASAYRYTPADLARTAVDTLTGDDADRAARWMDADRIGRRGRRVRPDAGALADTHRAAIIAADPAGDPCGDPHPRTRHADRSGGWQATTDHGPIPVGRITVRTPGGDLIARDLTPAELAAINGDRGAPADRTEGDGDGDTAPRIADMRERDRSGRAGDLTVIGYAHPITGRPCSHDYRDGIDPATGHRTGDRCDCVPVTERRTPVLTDGSTAATRWDRATSAGVTAPSRRRKAGTAPTIPVGARTRA